MTRYESEDTKSIIHKLTKYGYHRQHDYHTSEMGDCKGEERSLHSLILFSLSHVVEGVLPLGTLYPGTCVRETPLAPVGGMANFVCFDDDFLCVPYPSLPVRWTNGGTRSFSLPPKLHSFLLNIPLLMSAQLLCLYIISTPILGGRAEPLLPTGTLLDS